MKRIQPLSEAEFQARISNWFRQDVALHWLPIAPNSTLLKPSGATSNTTGFRSSHRLS